MKVNRRVWMIIGVAGSLLAPQSAALAQDAISTPQKQIGGAKTNGALAARYECAERDPAGRDAGH